MGIGGVDMAVVMAMFMGVKMRVPVAMVMPGAMHVAKTVAGDEMADMAVRERRGLGQ